MMICSCYDYTHTMQTSLCTVMNLLVLAEFPIYKLELESDVALVHIDLT